MSEYNECSSQSTIASEVEPIEFLAILMFPLIFLFKLFFWAIDELYQACRGKENEVTLPRKEVRRKSFVDSPEWYWSKKGSEAKLQLAFRKDLPKEFTRKQIELLLVFALHDRPDKFELSEKNLRMAWGADETSTGDLKFEYDLSKLSGPHGTYLINSVGGYSLTSAGRDFLDENQLI